jgi:elongation factor G
MKVVVETPSEFSGGVLGGLMQRRAMIVGSQEDGLLSRIEAEVPLAEMFGYSTNLRSSTQGKAEFTMEFSRYLPVPTAMAEELMTKAAGKKAAEAGKK